MTAPRQTVAAILLTISTAGGMDRVRQETRTDRAVDVYGVTGAGIAIAILDRGIDWSHPDFVRDDGTTRIRWLLDMSGQSLCDTGNPAPVEYTEAQINAALAGGPSIGSRDAVGHGTVTAGIAAGNGRAFAGGKYRGIAPDADLIIVKLTSEGAPAHDGQAAETAFQGCIDGALDWLDAKIDALGRPCVGLINSGVQWGPMDGTSAVSRKIDEVFGPDRPGRVYVAAAGDEGNLPTHAGADYDSGGDTIVRFTKLSSSTAWLSMWYTGSRPASVTISFDGGPTVGPVPAGGWANQNGIFIIQYAPAQAFYPWQSDGPDRAVWMRVTGHSGPGEVRVRGQQPLIGHFDLYHGDLPNSMGFDDHLVAGRLTDYATSLSATVAGAHVNLVSYTDINGINRFVGAEGGVDELWLHSAGGPTRDGRLHGVDVSGPGHNCFAAYAPDSWWAAFDSRLINDGGGWYGLAGATSGSAPIVVGAAALMLQRNPALTAQAIRQILRDTARTDEHTGAAPNASWGFGKLDVAAAVARTVPACSGDGNGDGLVNVDDLTNVIIGFGTDGVLTAGDLDGSGLVDVDDLVLVILGWGACAR